MKSKKSGYATIECIISMGIICIGMYIVSISMYNSYSAINNNEDKFKMLNIAKSEIEVQKQNIQNNKIIEVSYYNRSEGYIIETNVVEEEYHNLFKISVSVNNEKNIVSLDGYAFKQ